MSFSSITDGPSLHEPRYFTFKSMTLTGADATALQCNDTTVNWSYSSDTGDDYSVDSDDTPDHCLQTLATVRAKSQQLTMQSGCASNCASGAPTRNSSFNLSSEGDACNMSGATASPSTVNQGGNTGNSRLGTTASTIPSRHNSMNGQRDGFQGIKHGSCNTSSRNSSAHNSKESTPCASRRGSFQQDTFQRHIEHDLLGGGQLVLLTKEVHAPHLQIHVEEKVADRMVAHSTAVMRTTRNGQAVLRRSYGEQTTPTPTGSTIRGAFSVMSKRSPGSHSASGDAYGASTHNLQRSGAASETMIDSIEALMDAQGTFTKPGFAKQTVGAMMSSVKHHKK